MEYTLYYTIGIPEDLDRESIKSWWVKWGMLHFEMKDGKTVSVDSDATWDQVDWKRGHSNLQWVDDDHNDVLESVHE